MYVMTWSLNRVDNIRESDGGSYRTNIFEGYTKGYLQLQYETWKVTIADVFAWNMILQRIL